MKVKKIAALAVGAAMVGATMGFASATEVPNIPKDFFVKPDGTPNVKIVVGSSAAAMDVASAADIAVALGSLLYTEEQVEVQGDYVKIKAEYPPETVKKWTIYKYDASTIRNKTAWATGYDKLPGDYWWNGAGYDMTYDEWKDWFQVTTTIPDKDKIGDKQIVDWHVTFKNLELKSKNPSDWDKKAPPKDANIVITPGNVTVLVDYVLYNYSIVQTKKVRDAYPEWGVPAEYQNVTVYYIGDAENVAEDNGTIVKTYTEGVKPRETFTVFGETYYVLDVGNNSFVAGLDKGTEWYQVGEPQAIEGTDWVITVLDISIVDQRALVTVKNAVTGKESDQVILEKGNPVDVFGDGAVILTLEDTFVGIDGHLIASISAQVNVKTYKSGHTITYDGKKWKMIIHTDGNYIKNITLTNLDKLEGNPVDVFGKYDLKYKFDMKSLNEKKVNYDINGDGNITDTDFVVAYAYLCLKEKQGKLIEKELKVGDKIPDTDFVVEEIHATVTKIEPKPVSEPITVMDFEVNMEDPGANLILVGGPVANKITKWLVDQNISKVDWYNSPGEIEYIPDALGGYDVVIVAGATRNETRAAAEALMQYLASLH
ncbi:S-layer protein [Thermococcus sp.]|uniref:S-layer protein n=1 Tax=Thermococcus sp. TaxID=35749 RepID=UPI002625E28F|nr:S-layer protein [Thermococcus sp.]